MDTVKVTSEDGAVSIEEFKDWIKQLTNTLHDPQKAIALSLDVMFRACDLDGNERLSMDKFSKFLREKGLPLKDSEIKQLYKAVDVYGDTSSFTKEELLSVILIGMATGNNSYNNNNNNNSN